MEHVCKRVIKPEWKHSNTWRYFIFARMSFQKIHSQKFGLWFLGISVYCWRMFCVNWSCWTQWMDNFLSEFVLKSLLFELETFANIIWKVHFTILVFWNLSLNPLANWYNRNLFKSCGRHYCPFGNLVHVIFWNASFVIQTISDIVFGS